MIGCFDLSIIKVLCVGHRCEMTTHEHSFTSHVGLLPLHQAGQLVTHSFVQSAWYLEQRKQSLGGKSFDGRNWLVH